MKCDVTSRLVALGALLSLIIGAHGFAAETPRPPENHTVQEAYQQLLSTKLFAFGGIGYAGTISKGEKAFHTVAAGTNALKLFAALVRNGNAEAQMYGLCGIRKLAPQSFEAQARPFLSANSTVNTMSGCLAGEDRASNVVARIAAGSCDLHISNAQIH